MNTTFAPHPNADGLVKLTGTISNLKVTRDSASFVFTQSDQTKMGVIAIAASIAGLGGQAIATAANATSMEEEADYLEFELDGKPIKGWVWRNPFQNGDMVTVAVEPRATHLEAFGIARPKDKTVALYPHCSRGRAKHYTNAAKWWVIGCTFMVGLMTTMAFFIGGTQFIFIKEGNFVMLGIGAFLALMTYSLTRKWMPFVRLAEKVFRALELPNPSSIDLVKTSEAQRTEKDPGEFGTFYFRY